MVITYFAVPGVEKIQHRQQKLIDAERIIKIVCSYFDKTFDQLKAKGRQRDLVEPRQICCYLMTRHTKLPLVEIGQMFGARDHTTIIHSRDTVRDRIYVENDFAKLVKQIEELI